jgi:lipopolysaccharide export system protein LptC
MSDATLSPEPHDVQRVRRAMAAWRRRSRLIKFYRRALPAAIGVVLAGMAGWVTWRTLAGERADLGDPQVVRLVNARFFGQDAQGRPFVLGAAEATRPLRGDTTVVRLTSPSLEIDHGGKTTTINATRGIWNEKSLIVRLFGQVQVREPTSGFRMDTSEAIVDTQQGVVTGPQPVVAQGPLGRVDAKGYAIYEQGARIVFRGDGTPDGRLTSVIRQRR